MSPEEQSYRFVPGHTPPEGAGEDAWLLVLKDGRLLADVSGPAPALMRGRPGRFETAGEPRFYLGLLDGLPVWAIAANGEAEPDGHAWQGLRRLYMGGFEQELFALVGRAKQLIEWDQATRFCGVCGAELKPHPRERAKQCPSCGRERFPRISPAVIVAVERDGKILLGRSPGFPGGIFSTLAGFVEPGETLEETVAREIREEVGIEVKDITYFGSQPWPFPDSLMVGFTARWAAGEIAIDGVEIEAADWFAPDALPPIPKGYAIARRLIDDFLARNST